MEDTGMPVNLTVCGPGWSDFDLLRAAYDYEQASRPRLAAAGTPSLSYDPRFFPRRSHSGSGPIEIDIEAKARLNGDGSATITGRAEATAGKAPAALSLFIDGSPYDAGVGELKIESRLTRTQRGRQFRSLLCVLAYGGNGEVSARHLEVIYE
jgi:hypothetical protein